LQSTNTLLSRRAWRDTLRMRKASGVAAVTYDWRRTGRYMTFGLLDGTCSHYWFEALDGFLRRSFPAAAGVQETALACTFDVVFFTPLWTAAFLSYMSLSAGVGTSPCLGPLPPAAASQLRSLSLSTRNPHTCAHLRRRPRDTGRPARQLALSVLWECRSVGATQRRHLRGGAAGGARACVRHLHARVHRRAVGLAGRRGSRQPHHRLRRYKAVAQGNSCTGPVPQKLPAHISLYKSDIDVVSLFNSAKRRSRPPQRPGLRRVLPVQVTQPTSTVAVFR
jgi:hypothetical protein